jgi:hypothetical protein
MKRKSGRKKATIVVLSVILILGSSYIPNIFSQAIIGVNVNIRPVIMLEVFTPSQNIKSAGNASALLTTPLNINENPIYIRVRLAVSKNQIIQLRVQANGDLINTKGEIIPISNVAWHAQGQGFQDGILSKESPQVIATFVGPGFYEGIINYYWVNPPPLPHNFTQIITYTLTVV